MRTLSWVGMQDCHHGGSADEEAPTNVPGKGERVRYDCWRIPERATIGGIRKWQDERGPAILCEQDPLHVASCHHVLLAFRKTGGRSTPESCVCKAVASGK